MDFLKPGKIEKVDRNKRIPVTQLRIGEAGEVNDNECFYLRAGDDCFLMVDETLGFVPYTLKDMTKEMRETTVQPVRIAFTITTK